jgi:hypothetical protein
MTSRIDSTPDRTISIRSTPMPPPVVGAIPYSSADHRVEVLGQARVLGVALADREQVQREVEHVGGLEEGRLDVLGVERFRQLGPRLLRVDGLVHHLDEILAAGLEVVDSHGLLDRVAQRDALPRSREVDHLTVVLLDPCRPERAQRDLLGQLGLGRLHRPRDGIQGTVRSLRLRARTRRSPAGAHLRRAQLSLSQCCPPGLAPGRSCYLGLAFNTSRLLC